MSNCLHQSKIDLHMKKMWLSKGWLKIELEKNELQTVGHLFSSLVNTFHNKKTKNNRLKQTSIQNTLATFYIEWALRVPVSIKNLKIRGCQRWCSEFRANSSPEISWHFDWKNQISKSTFIRCTGWKTKLVH